MFRAGLVCVLLLSVASHSRTEERSAEELVNAAFFAHQEGKQDEALGLVNQALAADGNHLLALMLRARIYERQGKFAEAIDDLTKVIGIKPDLGSYQFRGVVHFKAGHINESIADFDKFIELKPEQEPHHWQRGISYYYAGRYADGRKQFELHQTVNPNDVENAVWHFLCYTREKNADEARQHLIPITGDARVPMPEVHKLFAGEGTADDVLRAAEAGKPTEDQRKEHLFYGHLYLGLYYEAIGDDAKAREHILTAADKYPSKHYMGDVARVHAAILRAAVPKS